MPSANVRRRRKLERGGQTCTCSAPATLTAHWYHAVPGT